MQSGPASSNYTFRRNQRGLLTLWGNVRREIALFALGILVACMLLAGARALHKAR
jgi:hypothetical protein